MATLKQKLAFKEVGVNGGNISKAMKSANYAPSITHATEKLTNSKGWQELMNKFLPDKLLAQKHLEGLEANRIISANITYGEADEKTNDFIEVPDQATRHKFLDTAYKLKGRYITDDNIGNKTLIINIVPETAQRYAIPPSTETNSTGQTQI
jgi:hypothetical protein